MSAISLPRPLNLHVPRWALIALAALVVVALIAGTIIVRSQNAVQVTTAPVVRQTLTQSITASGTVNAQNSISVGTQVSGTISELDVDFNSKVKKGQVLARIDPSTIAAQLDQASSNLAQAQAQAAEAVANASGAGAGVTVASDSVAKAQDALVLAQQQYSRDAALLAQGYVPQATVDTDRSNLTQAQAAVAGAQAAVSQSGSSAQAQAAGAQAAQAAIGSAAAVVQEDTVNLHNTVIKSPVDGTVVSRAVSVGQTVAASLQTPTLFTIAQNLAKMEVDVNVGEPDIGGVKKGDNVDFTVLAYPTTVFHGTVDQVRINPQTLNNVVTYDVVVDVNNTDGKLLPGMTANATIAVASANNALVVPLAAVHATLRQAQGDTGSTASAGSPWGGTASGTSSVAAGQNATLTVQRDGKLQRVQVQVGLVTSTQAAVTPINGSTLSQGDNVVTAFSGSHKGSYSGKGQGGQTASANPLAGGANSTKSATRGIP